jgi:hypothetical protein
MFQDAPTLMKFTPDGTIAYEENPRQTFRKAGAIRFNNDFTQVAVASSGTGEGGGITIYPVLENGMPDWENGQELDVKATTGYSIKDFAWDYANNLYVAADMADGTAGQCIAIYATPHAADRVVSTPVASSSYFTLAKKNGGVTTSMEDVNTNETVKVEKIFLNGHLYIQRANTLYTPTGARVK